MFINKKNGKFKKKGALILLRVEWIMLFALLFSEPNTLLLHLPGKAQCVPLFRSASRLVFHSVTANCFNLSALHFHFYLQSGIANLHRKRNRNNKSRSTSSLGKFMPTILILLMHTQALSCWRSADLEVILLKKKCKDGGRKGIMHACKRKEEREWASEEANKKSAISMQV
jgi:hypothetical protein